MVKRIMLLFLVFLLAVSAGEAQRPGGKDRKIFGRSLNPRQAKPGEPKSVVKAKKKQEANAKKQDKEYEQYVKDSRKRAVKIQSPEVKDRMLQNRKDADKQYKVKRKNITEKSRKAGRKYK